MFRSLFAFAASAVLLARSAVGFGLTESGNSYIVDTEGGLIFTIEKNSGDITSLKFNGIEAQGTSKRSHISSGIGASCSWTRPTTNYIKVTCTTSTLTQYYVARYKDPSVHMATFTTAQPSIGELRFIARLRANVITNGHPNAKIGGTAIEGSDVYLINGQTKSKFYSSIPFIRDQVHGGSGNGIGAYMVMPGTAYEKASGGPFFRDINNQGGSDQEIYYYMNSGHTQTEAYRQGLHGPYALTFTTGGAPSGSPDTNFWDGLSVNGWVPRSGRGRVVGTASGIPSSFSNAITVGWSNAQNQYWATASGNGAYTSPYMIPGTYTVTLYKSELAVATSSVGVSAGGTVTKNIASTEANPASIWQIGEFDGTPRGFLNADLIESMHPSDSRMHDWLRTYTVGQQGIGYFPMAIFKNIGPVTVRFALASGQNGARTLQIGTTLAFAGGRPIINVNGAWSSPTPPAPTQPDSRGVTRGTWRGNNILYTYSIPAGVLTVGSTTNVITISVASGSSSTNAYLSPNIVLDAVRLF